MATQLDAIAAAVTAQLVPVLTKPALCIWCQHEPVPTGVDLCEYCEAEAEDRDTEEREARFRLSHRESRPAA